MRQPEQHWIDTLRLDPQERQVLLAALDENAEEARFANLRADQRVRFEMPSGVVTKIYQPGGSPITYLIHPRNLSRTGMSFLHGTYVYDHSRVQVHLRTIKDQTAVVTGSVVWCRHVRGRVHEIGVSFNHPIVLSAFVKELPRDDKASLRTRLAPLHQRLLYVDDCLDDQELLAFHCKSAGIDLLRAADALAALEIVETKPIEAVVAAVMLPGMSGLEMLEALRATQFTKPVVLLSVDASRQTQELALARGATAVMNKPYVFEDLAARLCEHLPREQCPATGDALVSEHWGNAPMRPLIQNFLARLQKQVRQLSSLIGEAGNQPILEKLCLDLRGSAGGYGYPSISEAARGLYEELRAGAAVPSVMRRMSELSQLCDSARRTCPTAKASA